MASSALAYRAPYSLTTYGTVTHNSRANPFNAATTYDSDTYSITDPVTLETIYTTVGGLYGYGTTTSTTKTADGYVFFCAGYADSGLTRWVELTGFSTYDPCQGQWKSTSITLDTNGAASYMTDGVGYAYVYGSNPGLCVTTYDPSVGDWVSKYFPLGGGTGVTSVSLGNIGVNNGEVFLHYIVNSGTTTVTHYYLVALYDPSRKAWASTGSSFDPRATIALSNGVITDTPPPGPGATTYYTVYSFASGTFVSGTTVPTVTPFPSFYVGKSYKSTTYPNVRWVTDMSFGPRQTPPLLMWGDGSTSSTGGGYHTYASNQQWTLTQIVSDWQGGTVSSTKSINVPPTVSVSVDGYASGSSIIHAAGSPPSVTAHFSATAYDGTIAIRYNALNATTSTLDNGNGAFTAFSTGSGQITKTFTLTDGDWYFWTDAQDSSGNQNNTPRSTAGYKITVDTPPVPTISVDGYSSGAQIYHNYGQGVTVTVHYNATAPDSNLSGIRYNIWNSSTNSFDNGGNFVAESGASGQLSKTFTLTDDGDWYFWTDAQDSVGGYASTGAWGSGFKITLIQNGQPAQTPSPSARLVNLSVRAPAGTGSNTLISGFILSGGGAEPILINGKGPSMIPMGLDGLANPNINLYQGSTVIASNDNWGSASNASQISATGLAPTNSLESSIYQALNPTGYTVLMGNSGSGTIGMLELDDMNGGSSAQLVNISGRAYIGTGNSVVIAGFIISGGPKRVLINGKGPSLAAMGVSGVITDPTLTLYNSSGPIQSNNNWQTAWNATAISGTQLGPTDAHEAAIDEVLPAGVYTVILSGYNNATGVGMVEIDGL